MKTNSTYSPETDSMVMSFQAESEAELALLCWLRTTAPEWDDAAPENIVRLVFKSSAGPTVTKTETASRGREMGAA
jgi:hypothetical protein